MVWNNPVLSKEYRLRMRSARAPWMISVYLLIMGGIVLTYIALFTSEGGYFNPEQSRVLFILLSSLQLALIGFVTPGLTAGLISGERERQTLSILLTTHLSPATIVLSKLAAALSFMALLVLASLPLYAIVVLFGGISPLQLLQIFAFYAVTMFFIGSLGVFYSTVVKRTGVATVLAYSTVAAIVILTLIIGMFLQQFYILRHAGVMPLGDPPFWVTIWFLLNPVLDFLSIFFPNEAPLVLQPSINPFVFFLSVYGLLGMVMVTWAILILPPVRRRHRRQAAPETERG